MRTRTRTFALALALLLIAPFAAAQNRIVSVDEGCQIASAERWTDCHGSVSLGNAGGLRDPRFGASTSPACQGTGFLASRDVARLDGPDCWIFVAALVANATLPVPRAGSLLGTLA